MKGVAAMLLVPAKVAGAGLEGGELNSCAIGSCPGSRGGSVEVDRGEWNFLSAAFIEVWLGRRATGTSAYYLTTELGTCSGSTAGGL